MYQNIVIFRTVRFVSFFLPLYLYLFVSLVPLLFVLFFGCCCFFFSLSFVIVRSDAVISLDNECMFPLRWMNAITLLVRSELQCRFQQLALNLSSLWYTTTQAKEWGEGKRAKKTSIVDYKVAYTRLIWSMMKIIMSKKKESSEINLNLF